MVTGEFVVVVGVTVDADDCVLVEVTAVAAGTTVVTEKLKTGAPRSTLPLDSF